MKFAIIAAGEGSRLAQEGISLPKPLVELNGEPMLKRLLRIFQKSQAEEIGSAASLCEETVIIVNDLHPQTERYVRELAAKPEEFGAIRLVVKSTPSSMHSFYELSPYLGDSPFCLTTVDTVFREDEFARYIHDFRASDCDGMMAVTDYIDDEKPLYVQTDDDMTITGFYDTQEDCRFISGGIYCLRPTALHTLHRCMSEGQARMRNFQRGLVADGFRLQARLFSKILDVDHLEDVTKAEAFLNSFK